MCQASCQSIYQLCSTYAGNVLHPRSSWFFEHSLCCQLPLVPHGQQHPIPYWSAIPIHTVWGTWTPKTSYAPWLILRWKYENLSAYYTDIPLLDPKYYWKKTMEVKTALKIKWCPPCLQACPLQVNLHHRSSKSLGFSMEFIKSSDDLASGLPPLHTKYYFIFPISELLMIIFCCP